MSINTAMGRYFQLAPEQLKAAKVNSLRCPKGCELAKTLEFDGHRAMLVYATTRNVVTKLTPDGVNATAPRTHGISRRAIEVMPPSQMLDALATSRVRESELEQLYRESGQPLGKLAYLATLDDFEADYSPNRFARCSHISGYLDKTHYFATGYKITIESLPQ
ncbi:hypothetical protein WG936_04015 [Corynebacterium sp. H127]|uniref:hypothetical protein n=1 Tax=Corynebacterium sp. H127 TaxID=3133418 RepID=UPI003098BB08